MEKPATDSDPFNWREIDRIEKSDGRLSHLTATNKSSRIVGLTIGAQEKDIRQTDDPTDQCTIVVRRSKKFKCPQWFPSVSWMR